MSQPQQVETGGCAMKRRKNQEGNYGTREINGITYRYYRAPNGEWTVYAKTAKELEEKKKARELKAKTPKVTNKILLVSDLCDMWMKTMRSEISPGTYDVYENLIDVRIKKYKKYDIGNVQLYSLTPKILEGYLNSLTNKYAKTSIDKTWSVLKQTLEYGQEHEYVSKDLDLDKIKKPRERDVVKKKREIQFTTLSDVKILYDEAYKKDDKGRFVYSDGAKVLVFIMYSGLRIGEAIGLTWKYVSSDYSEIRVQHSNLMVVQRDKDGNPVYTDKHRTYVNLQKETKTKSGERIIPLPDRAKDVLRYFNDLHPKHKSNDYVFTNPDGLLYKKRSLERILRRLMNNSDCDNKNYTPHSLRHGYGSILLSQGVDIKTVSVLLGHKDVSTTYNIYIHVLDEDKRKAVTSVFNT